MPSFRELTRERRSLDPYLHVEPHFLNVAKCMKIFGQYFKDFYLSRTIKEDTEFARIFNQHLLVTYTMDACLDREVKTLGEVLCDPVPGQLFSSIETMAGTPEVSDRDNGRARLVLPFPFEKDVFITFYDANFLSRVERDAMAEGARMALICQVDLVKDDFIQADPLVMGTPSFDHFRNQEVDLALAPYVEEWFETLPGDIDEFADGAAGGEAAAAEWREALESLGACGVGAGLREITGEVAPPGDIAPSDDLIFAELHLSGTPITTAILTAGVEVAAMSAAARVAATPARLLMVQHCGAIDEPVRETLRAFAVAPHAPRRFCVVDGADTYRILKRRGAA